ncbi:MAG: hypothetical protein M3151_10170 [Actinomycetota bacterium]|nr:hypothetical protein [Actinomycetota bacterium]
MPSLADGEFLEREPLVVLSAESADAMIFRGEDRRQFTRMHEQMARGLSFRGEHRLVEGADHLSPVTDHEYALEVAVSEVVRQASGIGRVLGFAGDGSPREARERRSRGASGLQRSPGRLGSSRLTPHPEGIAPE